MKEVTLKSPIVTAHQSDEDQITISFHDESKTCQAYAVIVAAIIRQMSISFNVEAGAIVKVIGKELMEPTMIEPGSLH